MYASGYFPSRGAVKGWFADLALPASGVGTERAAFLCYRFSSLKFFLTDFVSFAWLQPYI